MTILLEKTFPRTLDQLIEEYANEAWRGAQFEAWVFEDVAARRAAEDAFAKAGVSARLYSAYKPLVHFFLEEEVARGPFKCVAITYPVDRAAPALRFLLESYPLGGMVGDAKIEFTAAQTGGPLEYTVALTALDNSVAQCTVFAPNRWAEDHLGEMLLSPCGWLRVSHSDGRRIDMPMETDYERAFREAMQAIDAYPWGKEEPFFEVLHITVSLPGTDTRLPVGEEVISLHEALHEEFYFSLNELFQRKTGRSVGSRAIQPGQIIPEIVTEDGPIALRIETRPFIQEEAIWAPQPLHEASGPFSTAQIGAVLDAIGGEVFGATSRAGRVVSARSIRGTDFPIMISGGQHANETSGVVGALRGASLIAERDEAHFAVSPLENPDGYALHWRLCQTQPFHMHHAARYTALGDDFESREREPLYEQSIRRESYQRTGALLHMNLHGYPAHEWTRPLTGYIPRGFESWTLPKGFFLIVRYHTGWAKRSRLLLKKVTARLREVPGLVAFNEQQIQLYEIHAGPLPFEVIDGFPCVADKYNSPGAPMTLITEFPDETVHGDVFLLAQEAQTRAVVAAYEALQEIMS